MDGKITLDVVIPSMRLDSAKMLGALDMDAPENVSLHYYIISDNPNMRSEEFVYNDNPVSVIVNKENLGASLSRNVGIDAGSGRFVLFIDDDVTVTCKILHAYMDAIKDYPDAPGYIGPTIFPKPVNSFTHGIVASGMLTFFELPSQGRLLSWGTTSNLMLRRDFIGDVRFSRKFPKHGGGEDIDFCIRISANCGKLFRTVPGAAVHHPWWNGSCRSYRRFFRWAFGDSLMINRHPKHAYYDVPDVIETLVIGGAVLVSMGFAGLIPPAMLAVWAGLVIFAEFLIEHFHVASHHPKSSVLASLEAALIRISSQLGRFLGPLSRKRLPNVCRRFDYITTGEWMGLECRFTRAKFALFAVAAPISYWLCMGW